MRNLFQSTGRLISYILMQVINEEQNCWPSTCSRSWAQHAPFCSFPHPRQKSQLGWTCHSIMKAYQFHVNTFAFSVKKGLLWTKGGIDQILDKWFKPGPQCILANLCLVQLHSIGVCFDKSVSGSLIAIRERAMTAKITVLLWNWRHWTRGRKFVATWSQSQSKTTQEGGLVRRVRLKTKTAVLERPIYKINLPENPRLHGSSLTLLILMSSMDCEQSLLCSEICGEERNEESKTSATASVTFEWPAPTPRAASSACKSRLRIITLARSRPTPLACVLLWALTHGFSSKRETAHSLCPQPRGLLVTSENSCFFIDLIVINHFEWIKWQYTISFSVCITQLILYVLSLH